MASAGPVEGVRERLEKELKIVIIMIIKLPFELSCWEEAGAGRATVSVRLTFEGVFGPSWEGWKEGEAARGGLPSSLRRGEGRAARLTVIGGDTGSCAPLRGSGRGDAAGPGARSERTPRCAVSLSQRCSEQSVSVAAADRRVLPNRGIDGHSASRCHTGARRSEHAEGLSALPMRFHPHREQGTPLRCPVGVVVAAVSRLMASRLGRCEWGCALPARRPI